MDLYDRLHPKPGAEQETSAEMLGRLRLERRARNGDKTAVERLGPDNAVVKLLAADEPGADGRRVNPAKPSNLTRTEHHR